MRIQRSIRIALAAGMLVAATGHAASATDNGASCGSDPAKPSTMWKGSALCHFEFRGLPLIVRGTATATGTARVRVWISATQGGPPILECQGTGSGSASCQAGLPDSSTNLGQLPPLQLLFCQVQGVSTGHYRCQSSFGI